MIFPPRIAPGPLLPPLSRWRRRRDLRRPDLDARTVRLAPSIEWRQRTHRRGAAPGTSRTTRTRAWLRPAVTFPAAKAQPIAARPHCAAAPDQSISPEPNRLGFIAGVCGLHHDGMTLPAPLQERTFNPARREVCPCSPRSSPPGLSRRPCAPSFPSSPAGVCAGVCAMEDQRPRAPMPAKSRRRTRRSPAARSVSSRLAKWKRM